MDAPKKRALVVDDSETNRFLLGAILSKANLMIEYAEDGDEAVDKFMKFHPDIVFIDQVMPRKNGSEALKVMRQNNPNFIGILLSAFSDPEEIKRIFEFSGAEEFMPKPFETPKILSVLKKYRLIE